MAMKKNVNSAKCFTEHDKPIGDSRKSFIDAIFLGVLCECPTIWSRSERLFLDFVARTDRLSALKG